MTTAVRFIPLTAHQHHPGLAGRKQILARFLVARNLRARAHANKVQLSEEMDYLIASARMQSGDPKMIRDDLRLDHFLKSIADRVEELANEQRITNNEKALIGSLKTELAQVCCATCSERVGAIPCNGTFNDDALFSTSMACWSFLVTLFEYLVGLAQSEYESVLSDAGIEELRVELRTTIAKGDELGAQTKFDSDSAGSRCAQIHLKLPQDTFVYDHLILLPYLLFHEIFVHAPEAWLEPANRPPTNERCSFREGFVDAAAANFLLESIKQRPEDLPLNYQDFAVQFRKDIRTAHEDRLSNLRRKLDDNDPASRRESYAIDQRRDGRDALEDVENSIGRANARDLAIALNVLPLGHDLRQLMVDLLQGLALSVNGSHRDILDGFLRLAQRRELSTLQQKLLVELAKSEF